MEIDIEKIKEQFYEEIKKTSSLVNVEDLKIKYLGKKGELNKIFKNIKGFSIEERKNIGPRINQLKQDIEKVTSEFHQKFLKKEELETTDFYKSLPGKKPEIGRLHVVTQAIREITDVFKPLGFNRVRYNEAEWDYYAFESLNIPKGHAARDEWETFFVKAPEDKKRGNIVLTPHTSSGQVREMEKGCLPIRMLNIGRCARRQSDINHIPNFYQFEGLVIDKGISIAHLKGTLDYFASNFFGPKRKIRIRPYDFRFTEPSFEIDINCDLCFGKGCRFCKEGWVELGGAGMVHPRVLEFGKINPKIYTGFAFGWGVERTYMMKSGTNIDDIRHLLNNDFRFLEQF